MAQFKAFADGVEINGQTVLAFIHGMESSKQRALQILHENGIINPQPGKWYSQQSWLSAFQKIAENVGPYALYCIGTKIPENAQFPPEINSLEAALASIDTAYHMNHRGGEIGNYRFHKSPDGSLHITAHNPYPCEFDRGLIEGIARQYTPAGHYIVVKHDDNVPCRENGADSCSYRIEIAKAKSR